MGIEIKRSFEPQKLGEEVIKKTEKKLGATLEEMAEQIVTRSRNQNSVDGGRFKQLSAEYAKRKRASGRSAVPDLTFSGKMLAAITSAVERTGNVLNGRIFFNSVREAEKARGNMKIRNFFGLSKEQIQTLTRKLRGA